MMAYLCSHGMTSGCIQCEERYGKSDAAQKRRELAERLWKAGYAGFANPCGDPIAEIEQVLAEQEKP